MLNMIFFQTIIFDKNLVKKINTNSHIWVRSDECTETNSHCCIWFNVNGYAYFRHPTNVCS